MDLSAEDIQTNQEASPSINIYVMFHRKHFIEGSDRGYTAMELISSSESVKVTAKFSFHITLCLSTRLFRIRRQQFLESQDDSSPLVSTVNEKYKILNLNTIIYFSWKSSTCFG
jgi:hypothetical protein